ncbi:hypothetical protein CK232_13775 [Mesorhizobium sp. WSM4304]|nr:hypothetical protein CK232_13775 [Mesorhizobium sp. WSM4304]
MRRFVLGVFRCQPVAAGLVKVIDANALKAKQIRVVPGSQWEGRKPPEGVLPASVDPGGRDVNTRFGLVAASL